MIDFGPLTPINFREEIALVSAFPLHRFEEFGKLSRTERDALTKIGNAPVLYRRHKVIRAEGIDPTSFYLLVDGWAAASRSLQDGTRQILKMHLPGDAVGTPSMAMTRTVEELASLTDVTLIEVPLERFWKLFEQHPRIGARFMLSIQLERIALMDRLAAIGRTSARAQIAAFVLDLVDRLAPLGLVRENAFTMVPTQEQIGDLLGMTAVHVNRTLRALDKEQVVTRSGQRYAIINLPALEELAERPRRKLRVDLAYLPAGR